MNHRTARPVVICGNARVSIEEATFTIHVDENTFLLNPRRVATSVVWARFCSRASRFRVECTLERTILGDLRMSMAALQDKSDRGMLAAASALECTAWMLGDVDSGDSCLRRMESSLAVETGSLQTGLS